MRSVHPAFKFIGIFISAVLLALFYRPLLNLSVFVACVSALLISRADLKSMLAVMIPAIIIAAGMFATGYYFQNTAALGITREIFTDGRIYNGLQLSSRVLAFAGLGLLFVLTTDKTQFVRSLEQRFRLPPKFAYGVLAAWGMLPNMAREYKKARAAFNARGLRPSFISPALLTPLLVKSVRWSEALAAAMESKGFSEDSKRTRYEMLPVRHIDISFPIFTCLLVIFGLLFLY